MLSSQKIIHIVCPYPPVLQLSNVPHQQCEKLLCRYFWSGNSCTGLSTRAFQQRGRTKHSSRGPRKAETSGLIINGDAEWEQRAGSSSVHLQYDGKKKDWTHGVASKSHPPCSSGRPKGQIPASLNVKHGCWFVQPWGKPCVWQEFCWHIRTRRCSLKKRNNSFFFFFLLGLLQGITLKSRDVLQKWTLSGIKSGSLYGLASGFVSEPSHGRLLAEAVSAPLLLLRNGGRCLLQSKQAPKDTREPLHGRRPHQRSSSCLNTGSGLNLTDRCLQYFCWHVQKGPPQRSRSNLNSLSCHRGNVSTSSSHSGPNGNMVPLYQSPETDSFEPHSLDRCKKTEPLRQEMWNSNNTVKPDVSFIRQKIFS